MKGGTPLSCTGHGQCKQDRTHVDEGSTPNVHTQREEAMKFNDVMHVAFYTDRMDEMLAFYTQKLGCKVQVLTRYSVYLDRDDRPQQQAFAREHPDAIFNAYIELAPGQFIELFPKMDGQVAHDVPWNSELGYSHYALTVDDIFAAAEELKAAGIEPDTPVSKGPSGTYQFWVHDPDGNKFEIMQYTDDSYQVKGHIDAPTRR